MTLSPTLPQLMPEVTPFLTSIAVLHQAHIRELLLKPSLMILLFINHHTTHLLTTFMMTRFLLLTIHGNSHNHMNTIQPPSMTVEISLLVPTTLHHMITLLLTMCMMMNIPHLLITHQLSMINTTPLLITLMILKTHTIQLLNRIPTIQPLNMKIMEISSPLQDIQPTGTLPQFNPLEILQQLGLHPTILMTQVEMEDYHPLTTQHMIANHQTHGQVPQTNGLPPTQTGTQLPTPTERDI